MTVLRAERVVAGYGARDVLAGIDLAIRGGEVVALIGPNGAGKTTLVRALCGLRAPRSGRVTLDGVDLSSLSRREIARGIAVVPQVYETVFPFTVGEVVALGRTPHLGALAAPGGDDRAAVRRAIAELELGALAGRRVDEISGGERQRAVLAMALAQEPRVLLLDEPTVHLDPAHQRATFAVLRRLARDRAIAVLAVLHDLNLAAALCDRVVVVRSGVVAADGAPHDVLRQALVDAVFGPGLRVLDGVIPVAIVPRA